MSGFLLPIPESNLSNKKSLKKLSISNGSKRLRTDESYDFVTFSDDHDAKKIRYDHLRCLSDAGQKFGPDNRRIDKKSLKTCTRTKYDTSKSGFISTDSAIGAVSKIGVNSLKSDINDLTKHVDELSINELLDGTYKHPDLNPKRGEKVSSGSESILLSVRKACSIIQLQGASESSMSNNLANDKDKYSRESLKEDSCQPLFSTMALHKPIEILERLALSQTLGLDSFVQNIDPSQGISPGKSSCTSELPSFPWSLSYAGSTKASVDYSKSYPPKSTSQSKWARIGRCSSTGSDYLSNIIDVSADQKKIAEVLQDIEEMDKSMIPLHASVAPNESKKIELAVKTATSRLNEKVKVEFPDSDSTFKDSEFSHEDQRRIAVNDFSQSCYSRASKNCGECNQNQWLGSSSGGENAQLIAAAATLYKMKMSKHSTSLKFHKEARSKSPVRQKLIKDRAKSTSSLEKAKRLYLSSTESPFRTKKAENVQSTSGKVARMLNENDNPIKPRPPLHSQVKIEKKYENQQKLKKESKNPSLVANGRNQFKDWSRRKSQ